MHLKYMHFDQVAHEFVEPEPIAKRAAKKRK